MDQQSREDETVRRRDALGGAVRTRYERSSAQELIRHLQTLDFGNQAMILGAGLLASLLPFMILLSAFASARVDSSLTHRLGLSGHAAVVVRHLFKSAPASLNFSTLLSMAFVLSGTFAVASSLQQIYEKVFDVEHRGVKDWPRLVIWVAGLCGVITVESLLTRPARSLIGGSILAELVTFAIFTPFFWWSMHFLLGGRIDWRRLGPSALFTGAFFVLLGLFSQLYFSSTIDADSRTYGAIGAVFGILTWLVAIGAVLILGPIAGVVWQARRGARTVSDE